MQRSLLDYVGKKAGSAASKQETTASTRKATVSAVATTTTTTTAAAGGTSRPRSRSRSPSASKRARGDSARAPSSPSSVRTGESKADAVDLAESSCSVAEVAESTASAPILMSHSPTRLPGTLTAAASSSLHESSGAVSTTGPSAAPYVTSSRWLAALITDPAWRTFLQPITADRWRNGGFVHIERFLDGEASKKKVVLPPAPLIFNAFNSCPFAELKVVLLGQDPYHDLNQAHGLCFSVLPGVRLPPSLRNMYKELATDIPGFEAPTHGYLQSWSEQGMLMLNATLTVEAHNANSHSKTSGWQQFTDAVIHELSQRHPNRLVFLLWGSFAQQKKKLIDTTRHVVIESVHPSPLSASRGWFGCRCFSSCNAALRKLGHTPMYWQLPLQAPTLR